MLEFLFGHPLQATNHCKGNYQSKADIVCLQECALDVFEYLSAYLTYTGMYGKGHFLQKRNGSDGCAMFYNVKKFSLGRILLYLPR